MIALLQTKSLKNDFCALATHQNTVVLSTYTKSATSSSRQIL